MLLGALMLYVSSLAQDNAIAKYFSTYQSSPDVTKVSVTSKMFSLFTELDFEDEDEKAVLEAIGKLKGIKAIIDKETSDGNKAYFEAVKKMEADRNYEELMTVEDVKENVRFMIRDEGEKISELLMLRGAEQEFMVMTLFGEIDLNAIGSLSRVMKIRGMEGFGILSDDHGHRKSGKHGHHKKEKH